MKKIKRKQIDFGGTENQYIKGNGELGELNDISVGDDSIGSGASLPDGYYFPNALKDLDDNWYGAVVIGNQVWLAENYRCTKFPDGTSIINGSAAANGGRELNSSSIPYYYWKNNDPLTVDAYGLKYNFSAISAGEGSTTVPGAMKGIAPVNWHIPSPEEYTTLLEYIKSKTEYNVTVKDGKYSSAVLAHPSSLGVQTLLNITEKEKEILNATGFGFKEYMLLTSELLMTIVGMSAQERVTVFYQGDSPSDGKRYNTLIGTEMSSALPTGFGEYLRIVSDFNPIQFRNWYVSTYGTMQHHLGEDDNTLDTLSTLTIKTNGQTLETYDPASGEDKLINILIPQSATDLGALPNSTKYATSLDLHINPSTFVITGQLYDQDNNPMGQLQVIDLPLESVVVDGTYNSQTGNIILTLQNGNTIEFPVTALVNGLQNVQPDWNQTDSTKDDYIKNKPTIPSISDIPTVRTMNHEQLTDSTLGDINIHDGFYFPNAIQDADGNWYGAVVIGDQVWMAENYHCTKLPNGTQIVNGSASANNGAKLFSTSTPYYYWFDDSEATVAEQGLLYNVSALMNGGADSTANPSNIQGIAPEGWHIPSGAEFIQLTDYISKQQRFIANKVTFQGEVFDDIQTLSLHSKSIFTSSDIASLIENEANSINATGFNIRSGNGEVFYFTTDEHGTNNNDEYSTGCSISLYHVGTNNIKTNTYIVPQSTISLHDSHTEYSDDGPNSAGAWIRCVSDLTPVQFRNWYIAQYGSLQHHILDDVTNDQLNFVVEVTRHNTDNAITYTCNKTGKEVYENVCVKKKNLIVALKSNSSSTGHTLLFKRNEGITTPANGSTRYSANFVDDDPTNFFDSVVIYSLVASYKEDGTINEIVFSKNMDYEGWQVKQIDGEDIVVVSPTDDVSMIRTHDGEYYPNAIQDRDGNWYGAVIIGNQVWLGENLKTTKYADGTPILDGGETHSDSVAHYYNINDQSGMENIGLRYNWVAIMNGASSSNSSPSGVQGVAPNGCHIPSDAEWTELITYTQAKIGKFGPWYGKALCSQKATYAASSNHRMPGNNPSRNDYTGFNAVPSGYGGAPTYSNSQPFQLTYGFEMASCTEDVNTSNMLCFGYNNSGREFTLAGISKIVGVAVRCIVDKNPMQFRAWYIEQYGTMQHHLKDEILQSDWNQDDSTKQDYIKNKPELPIIVEFTSLYNYSTIANENCACNKTAIEILEALIARRDVDYKLNFSNGDRVSLTDAGEEFTTTVQGSITQYVITKRLFNQNLHSEDYVELLLHLFVEKNTTTGVYTVNSFYAIANHITITSVEPHDGNLNIQVNEEALTSFGADQSTNTTLDFKQGPGITLEKDTTNNRIVISSESNHRVTSKDLILTSQNNSTLYKYNVLCELNDVKMSLVDLHDFSPNINSNFYNNDNVYVWTKAANEIGKYIGLCHARSSDAKFVGKLTINDSINNEVISYYMGIIVDTPPNTTFTFVTNCSWDVIARLDTTPQTTNYNIYAYVKIPDNFVGTISFTPLRRTITSPPNPSNVQVGCFDYAAGTTTVQDYFWKDAVTGGTQNLDTVDVLLLDSPAPGTNGVTTPFGKYQCNIIGDFGGTIAVNSKISDFVVNDFYLHSMEERVRSITSLYNLLPSIPTPTVADAGKVLTVDSSGNYVLQTKQPGSISSN